MNWDIKSADQLPTVYLWAYYIVAFYYLVWKPLRWLKNPVIATSRKELAFLRIFKLLVFGFCVMCYFIGPLFFWCFAAGIVKVFIAFPLEAKIMFLGLIGLFFVLRKLIPWLWSKIPPL